MAYDEDLADRVRESLSGSAFEERRMFGGLAFLIGGRMCVSVSGRGGLLVQVPYDATEALLSEPGAEEFDMNGRAPKGWLRVRPEVLVDDDVLAAWVRRGVAAAAAKPPK